MNIGDSQVFNYTGGIQTFVAEDKGLYKLEVWGAQGGTVTSGKPGAEGGYSVGYIQLNKNDTLYVVCGGQGQATYYGGYNGGGTCGYYGGYYGAGGGGATHIAYVTGILSSIGKTTFDQQGLIVAGGGGAYETYDPSAPGRGGGLSGEYAGSYGGYSGASPGTQTGGYSFGTANTSMSSGYGGGAGGGYYGGNVGYGTAGAGGSGWIGGVPEIVYGGITYTPSTTVGGNTGDGKATITLINKVSYTLTLDVNPSGAGAATAEDIEYTELEYIQTNGNQYIDTGYKLSNNSRIETKFIFYSGTSVFGSFQGGAPWTHLFYGNELYIGSTGLGSKFTTGIETTFTAESNQTTYKYKYSINGIETESSYSGNLDINNTFKLFASSNGGGYKSTSRIYYMKMYDNGALVRDFIPIKRGSIIGMLDKVNNQFYYNNGSGTFIPGPEIKTGDKRVFAVPTAGFKFDNWKVDGYTQLDYIESTGTQWIDTGVQNTGMTTTLEFKISDIGAGSTYVSSSFPLFGCNNSWYFSSTYYNNSVLRYHTNNNYYYYDVSTPVATVNNKFVIKYTGYDMFVNGTLSSYAGRDTSWASTIGSNIWLWHGGYGNGYSKYKCYYCKIWNTGTLVRDFIPCRRNSDGAIGLYDRCTMRFYENKDTVNAFVAGSDVGDLYLYDNPQCVTLNENTHMTANFVAEPKLTLNKIPESYGSVRATEDYIELDYLESHGKEYIDTGIPYNTKIEVVCDVLFTTTNPSNQIWGYNGNGGCGIGTSTTGWWGTSGLGSIQVGDWYKTSYRLTGTNRIITVNNKQYSTGMPGAVPSKNILLFASYYDSSSTSVTNMCYARKKNIRIYSNDILVRDFIPAKRSSDGAIGLYDRITNKLFTNAGTGAFTYGKELNKCYTVEATPFSGYSFDHWDLDKSGYIQLEYIQSSGTQYIDTGLPITSTFGFEGCVNFIDKPSNNNRMGVANTSGKTNSFSLGIHSNSPTYVSLRSGADANVYLTSIDINTFATYKVRYNEFFCDDVKISDVTITENPYTFKLFAYQDSSINCRNQIIKYIKFYDGKNLTRDFIPVRYEPTGAIGLYDLVESKFYGNLGTGVFTAGPDIGEIPTSFTTNPFGITVTKDTIATAYFKEKNVYGHIKIEESPAYGGYAAVNAEYEELEYLESTGTQLINTGIVQKYAERVTLEFDLVPTTLTGYFGANGTMQCSISSGIGFTANVKSHCVVAHTPNSSTSITTDGVLRSTFTYSGYDNYPITLFALGASATPTYNNYTKSRLYCAKMYDYANNLVRDYIPVRRISDGMLGMVDRVTGKLFENNGTGDFVAGPNTGYYYTLKLDVRAIPYQRYSFNNWQLMSNYSKLNYLEADGNQFIDTGLVPNQNTKVEVRFKLADELNNYRIFGCEDSANGNGIYSFRIQSGAAWICGYNVTPYKSISTGYTPTELHKLVIEKGRFYLDDVLITSFTQTDFTGYKNAYLFGVNSQSNMFPMVGKIYYCKIWDGDKLVRDYQPAVKLDGNIKGMYESTENIFYENMGTGKFGGE